MAEGRASEARPPEVTRRRFISLAVGASSLMLLTACGSGSGSAGGGAATPASGAGTGSTPASGAATSGAAAGATPAAAAGGATPAAGGASSATPATGASGAATPAAGAASAATPATGAASAATPATGAAAGSTPATTAAANLQGARIHLLHWSSFVPAEDAFFKETVVNEWAKSNGVEMTVELVGQNDVQPKVSAALQSGSGPDIIQLQNAWAHLYADKLTDVSDISEKAGEAGGGFWEAAKANSQVDGKWLGAPFGQSGNALHFRQSIMSEAGGKGIPTTWDEFTELGSAVKEKSGSFVGQALGHSYGDPPTFAYPFLWSYGGAETDESGKTIAINSDATKQALTAFKTWFEACSDPQCLSWDDAANNRAYLAGQVWSTLNGSSIYLKAKTDNPDIASDTKLALLPKGPKGQFVVGTFTSFGIPTYVKDPAPAKEMLAYILSIDGMKKFQQASQGYSLAPYQKGASELWPAQDPNFDVFKQFGEISRWYGYPAPPTPAAAESASKYIVVDMFAKVAQGETPESAMQWAEGELKNVYKV